MSFSFQNSSLDTTHPNENEGKVPYLLLDPKRDDPSLLIIPVTKYFSL